MSSTAASKHFDEITLAITKIESQEPSIVVQGLNILTKKSFDALEANNVQFEHFPQLVVSLGSLLDVVNPLKDVIYGCSLASESSGLEYQNSWGRWRHSGNPTIKALSYNLDDNVLLLTVLNILRNLSFDTVNEQVMGASSSFLEHLTSIVLVALESGTVCQATHLAMETLINIAGRVDLTGKKRLQGYFFSEDTAKLKAGGTDAVQRNLMKLRLCRDLSAASHAPYVTAASALLSAVASLLCADSLCDRTMTLRAVELLGRIASNADNSPYLSACPPELLDSLVQLLCASTSFTEPLVSNVFQVNGDPLGRRRPPASVHVTSRALAAAAAVPSFAAAPNGPTTAGTQLQQQQQQQHQHQTPLPAAAAIDPALNITFGGVRAESMGSHAPGFPSSSNLAGLSSHSSSGALNQQQQQRGVGIVSVSSTAALAAMTSVAPYFVEGCDHEMRDAVLDALHALCSQGQAQSAPMQARLAQTPHLVQFLLRIARCYNHYNPAGGLPGTGGVASAGGVGGGSNFGATGGIHRTESMIKALQILSGLLAQPEGSRAFLALQSEFMVAACSDDFIAEVVCNKALPVQQDIKARMAYNLLQQQQFDLQFSADSQALY